MKLAPPFAQWDEHLAIDLPGARAVFTTRRGGFSTGPYRSLNLGRLTGDRGEAVDRNRRALEEKLGLRPVMIRQVHGARVRRVLAPPEPGPNLPEADGQATARAGIAPMVLVADCLPIAIAGDGGVAMLHAGWRGLAAGIASAGVRALHELGASRSLTAAIGPGAGGCCYEVGDEVHAVFRDHPGYRADGRNLDLKSIARADLERAGVDRVHDAQQCTICGDPALWFSHRRDRRVTGRQAGIAWLT